MTNNAFNWVDKQEYPFRSHYYNINGQRLHYIDEGKGNTMLFVHGTPSWSFEFRKLIRELRKDCRCIALDHIGFGLSDKPGDYNYSTINHSKTLEKFVLEKDLKDITLVVHDFGGPIGLNFAIRHPERILRIIIFNSWLWSSEGDPGFVKMRKFLRSPLLPFLYKQLNFSPRFILPGSYGDHKPARKIARHYTKPFANSRQRNGALAFARSLLNDQEWFQELWNKKDIIEAKPTLLVWGMKDPVIAPENLIKFEKGFSNSQTVRLESSGHSPQEEEPLKVVEAIRKFMAK